MGRGISDRSFRGVWWSLAVFGAIAAVLVALAGVAPGRSPVVRGRAAAAAGAAPAAVSVAHKWRVWRNWNSQKCMGVAGGNMTNGTKIVQWTCNGNPDQFWSGFPIPTTGTSEAVEFRNLSNPNKCLGVPGGLSNFHAGVQLVIWDCLDHPDQYFWTFHANLLIIDPLAPDDACMFGDIDPVPPVSVAGASTADGAAIVVDEGYTILHNDQYWQCSDPN